MLLHKRKTSKIILGLKQQKQNWKITFNCVFFGFIKNLFVYLIQSTFTFFILYFKNSLKDKEKELNLLCYNFLQFFCSIGFSEHKNSQTLCLQRTIYCQHYFKPFLSFFSDFQILFSFFKISNPHHPVNIL
jgi:hypothetical protein